MSQVYGKDFAAQEKKSTDHHSIANRYPVVVFAGKDIQRASPQGRLETVRHEHPFRRVLSPTDCDVFSSGKIFHLSYLLTTIHTYCR